MAIAGLPTITRVRWRCIAAVLLTLCLGAADLRAAPSSLWLNGGELLPCPDMSGAQCAGPQVNPGGAVALKAERIEAAVAEPWWPEDRQNTRILTHMLLRRTAERVGDQSLTREQLWNHLAATYITRSGRDLSDMVARQGLARHVDINASDPIVLRGDHFVENLSRDERRLLIDHLSDRAATVEVTDGPLLRSFVSAVSHRVRGRQPRLLVLASGRDDAALAAQPVIRELRALQAEAEWWPLDAVMALALDNQECDRISALRAQYLGRASSAIADAAMQRQIAACQAPGRLIADLQQSDALVMLDGSIGLWLRSFINHQGKRYSWAEALASRFNGGQLDILANGAAAQLLSHSGIKPVMMADDDRYRPRLLEEWCARQSCGRDYLSGHGLGLFPYGLIDTHVADQGREFNLLRNLGAAAAPYAFGIDEQTLLHLRWPDEQSLEMQVRGAGAVLIADNSAARYQGNVSDWSLSGIRLHRLTPGARLRIGDEQRLEINLPRQDAAAPAQLTPPQQLFEPYFFRAWSQWFSLHQMPYVEAATDDPRATVMIRLQRPADEDIYVAANGLVAYRDVSLNIAFNRAAATD
ncbi:MAG: hypothetical protein Tsb002_26390 [Wenzhouxiangellaceae bacterium]